MEPQKTLNRQSVSEKGEYSQGYHGLFVFVLMSSMLQSYSNYYGIG